MSKLSTLLVMFVIVVASEVMLAKAQCDLPEPCQCPCTDGAVAFQCTSDGLFQAILIRENPGYAGLPPCAPRECSGNFCVGCKSDADCSWNNDYCIAYEQENECGIRGDKYRCFTDSGECGCGRCFSYSSG